MPFIRSVRVILRLSLFRLLKKSVDNGHLEKIGGHALQARAITGVGQDLAGRGWSGSATLDRFVGSICFGRGFVIQPILRSMSNLTGAGGTQFMLDSEIQS